MEQNIILTATTCLLLFGIIGIIDGFYYHLWKFNLYKHKETKVEHITHTIRAILFVSMIYLLFVNDFGGKLFLLGVGLFVLDVIVLIWDLIVEGDSRKKLGGLPHTEYMVHVIANALHVASMVMIIAIKPLSSWQINAPSILNRPFPEITVFVGQNLMPGVIILIVLHVLLMNKNLGIRFEKLKAKVNKG